MMAIGRKWGDGISRQTGNPADGGSRRLAGRTLTVASGLTVAGLGTIAMMALSARALSPGAYAAFATWWAVATLLGTTFGVFEAYLARLLVTDIAAGRNPTSVTGIMKGRGWLVAGAMSVVSLLLTPWLRDTLFRHSLAAALLLPVYVTLAATQALQRGAATGHSRFPAIAGQLITDGLFRAGLTVVMVLAGHATVGSLAMATCGAVAASLGVGDRMCPQWRARPRLRGDGVSWRPVVYLLIGAIGPLLANNGPVPWLTAMRAVGPYTLGAFAGAVTLSRIPTQFVSAAFGPLLTQLSHSVESGDTMAFRRLRRVADGAAAALGLGFVIAFAAVGHWVLPAYLGPGYSLSVGKLTLLASASALMFIAVVRQASLAALDRWGTIAAAWVFGTVALLAVLFLPTDALLRATVAPAVAVAAALVFMVAAGRHESSARSAKDVDVSERAE